MPGCLRTHSYSSASLSNLAIDEHTSSFDVQPSTPPNRMSASRQRLGKQRSTGNSSRTAFGPNTARFFAELVFPWLFPFGHGGIGNSHISVRISSEKQKKHYLLYHDKCFQLDRLFPLVAFSHEQVKSATSAGFIVSKQSMFEQICSCIERVNGDVLDAIIERLTAGEHVRPETDDEKVIFQLLNDLDHIAYKVNGSATTKTNMRSEVWSLLAYKGAPIHFTVLCWDRQDI